MYIYIPSGFSYFRSQTDDDDGGGPWEVDDGGEDWEKKRVFERGLKEED